MQAWLDRVSSNAAAGCCHSGSDFGHGGRLAGGGRSGLGSTTCKSQRSNRSSRTEHGTLSFACRPDSKQVASPRMVATAASSLQQIDYSFYQTLEVGEVTEQFLWSRLEPLLGYLSEPALYKVREALSLAFDSHHGQLRKSGEPYITHPVEVTRILAELQMDHESLIAGLLHDTVEDTQAVSFEEIGQWFGPDVRRIVEGETKFSKISKHGDAAADVKAQDLKQLFLAMTEEVRIIVVKLADRLHNMRTLESMPPHKQKKIADETLQVFAPLARLLGMYSIKEELEDLAFSYADPEAYGRIKEAVEALAAQQMPAVKEARANLEAMLQGDAYLQTRLDLIRVEVHQKALYSMYRKLRESAQDASSVKDVLQLRIVLGPRQQFQAAGPFQAAGGRELCYHVMGLVHAIWSPIPQSIKDYIATPKRNGYQALHTTVVPLGSKKLFPLEVQIRTLEMQRLAEYGVTGEYWLGSNKEFVDVASKSADQLARVVPAQKSLLDKMGLRLPSLHGLSPIKVNGTAGRYSEIVPVNGTKLAATRKMNGTKINAVDSKSNGYAVKKNGTDVVQGGKYGGQKLDRQVMARRINWLNSIREWQEEFVGSLTPREFVDCVTDDLLGRGVYVFTPSGKVMRLPEGATVVDFAYHVHTDVGNQMVGAKVNDKPVPPCHVLGNAEVVEVLQYEGATAASHVRRHQEWIRYAQTRSARHKLGKFLRDHRHLLEERPPLDPSAQPANSPPPFEQDSSATASSSAATTASPQPQTAELAVVPSPSAAGGRRMRGAGRLPTVDLDDDSVPRPPLPGGPAVPRVVEETWLVVEAFDRYGLLAEIAHTISLHRHNIKSYSGSPDPNSGIFFMHYQLEGDPARVPAMCNDIANTPAVRNWATGSGRPDFMPPPPPAHQS